MQVVAGLPVQVMDTLDDRQGLGGERQDMSAAIIRISYALDEAACLQSVKQANERNWPDVENLSEGGLIGPFGSWRPGQFDLSAGARLLLGLSHLFMKPCQAGRQRAPLWSRQLPAWR